MNKKTSIVKTFSSWMFSLVFTLILAFLSFWIYQQYRNYYKEIHEIENRYLDSQKSVIQNQVECVVKHIEYHKSQTKHLLKDELRKRALEAHAVALTIYNQNRNVLPEADIKKLIMNALRPFHYKGGEGIFAFDRSERMALSADQPEREGLSALHMQDAGDRDDARAMIRIAEKSKEGLYEHSRPKPAHQGKDSRRIAYIKLFEPYGWIIGTGEYLDAAERAVQREMLDWLNKLQFGKDGYIAAFTFDGVRIAFYKKEELGQNKLDFVDPNGVKVVQEGIRLSRTGEGGFVQYVGTVRPTTGRPARKISFFMGVPDWQWAVSTGVYIDEIDAYIGGKRAELHTSILQSVLYSIAVAAILSLILSYVLTLFSRRLTYGFQAFFAFFDRAARESTLIDGSALSFSEFRTLAVSANQMIDERRRTEGALRASEEQYRRIVETANEGIWAIDSDANTTYANQIMAELFGYEPREMIGRNAASFMFAEDLADHEAQMSLRRRGSASRYERRFRRKNGSTVWAIVSAAQLLDDQGRYAGSFAMLTDITERKRLEEQLVQAQKMEAVGRLAGGVAHDFNNLLTVILGYSKIILGRISEDQRLRNEVEQIKKAGERAASLTRQLLAFSRKQVLQPRVMDLNLALTDIEHMLKRLIGEDVELMTVQTPALGRVMADPGQIEQVIMNLAINARDAMPAGGRLTIETANVELDEAYARLHVDVKPGPYVSISVSDNGEGMDKKTLSHIFEPFFSTKETGKGTGLGLSTVYGIIKQSGGHVSVYSEPGRGSTFRIYLPQVSPVKEPVRPGTGPAQRPGGGVETILVVEDDDSVRELASDCLRECSYTVLKARNGEEALRVCKEHEGAIHLMVTDVIMPGMSGRELAKRMEALRPEMKMLYVSGYTSNAIVDHGVLEQGIAFLEKPFTPSALTAKVRDVLDESQNE